MVKIWVGDHPADDPLVAPLLADDLSGLPPAHIVLAQCDVLHDDGAAYAVRLLEAGVAVRTTVYERMPHGFLSLNRLCPPARPAVKAIADDVVRTLRGTPMERAL
jgi:acetyl esterase